MNESRLDLWRAITRTKSNQRNLRLFIFIFSLILIISYREYIFSQLYSENSKRNLPNLNFSSILCPNQSVPLVYHIDWSESGWQKESTAKATLYMYSAFFDDRPMAGDQYVRINVLASDISNTTFYCHLWYKEYMFESYTGVGIFNKTGFVSWVSRNLAFVEYILSCHVPLYNRPPEFVSVTEGKACKALTNLLPVMYKYHKEPPIEFGVCVVNGHGKFTPQEMVEWFEFYRLMGVEEFNLYNTSYKGVDDVLEYYVENKTLILNQIPHPLGPDDTVTKIRNLRSTCLNDCMMRNMYRYRYLVVVDHDEFIVPRGNITNYHDLIQESEAVIQAKEEIMSIGFVNTYFFKTFQPDLYKPSYLRTSQFRHRTKPLVPYTASKSILKPKFCFNLMNHYCYTPLPLYKGRISYFSPSHLAMSHHYRLCGSFTGTKSCSRLHGEKTADDTILKFETSLKASVENILSNLSIPIRL